MSSARRPDKEEVRFSGSAGRVVVVTFWASWCGPCRRELPVLDALQKVAGARARIVAVKAYPNLFVIGPDRKVASVHAGFGEGSLTEILDDINKQLEAAPTTTRTATGA